tara:strand:- start:2217 stop:3662 length:1446 start_codon:yes stop_codon:yes gene_type:complete
MESSSSTCQLFNADCLEKMKDIPDKSIDLIFNDLPYQQTSCAWDIAIDMDLYWKQVMRIKKLNTPIFFTTTTKFGVSLIQSAPKKCFFRYDLVWVKSAPAGFLCAKKMPMRKHEMVYVFYEKLPFYDLSSHTHKFIKERDTEQKNGKIYEGEGNKKIMEGKYDPPLPVSIVKEEPVANEDYDKREKKVRNTIKKEEVFGKGYLEKKVNFRKFDKTLGGKGAPSHLYDPPLPVSVVKEEKTQISKPKEKDLYGASNGGTIGNIHGTNYDPPLPVSVVKEQEVYKTKEGIIYNGGKPLPINDYSLSGRKGSESAYDPPLPVSVVKEESIIYDAGTYKKEDNADNLYRKAGRKGNESAYDPPLPVSVVKEEFDYTDNQRKNKDGAYGNKLKLPKSTGQAGSVYDVPLPTSMLEIKSTRGKHSTEKPVALMSWILKYYSKEGDTVLDPTCGSGSTGVACKEMNRHFIGIEMDEEIFKVAEKRLKD